MLGAFTEQYCVHKYLNNDGDSDISSYRFYNSWQYTDKISNTNFLLYVKLYQISSQQLFQNEELIIKIAKNKSPLDSFFHTSTSCFELAYAY